MDHVGIDVHKRESQSQICIETELGEVIEKRIRALADACRLGAYRPAHRVTATAFVACAFRPS